MGVYFVDKKFWPIVFHADFDDFWSGSGRTIKYKIYDDITDTATDLATTGNVDSTLRLATQPKYDDFPTISKLTLCSDSKISTGTGNSTNTCSTDSSCNTTTKFCLDTGKLFWCENGVNKYLGNIIIILIYFRCN